MWKNINLFNLLINKTKSYTNRSKIYCKKNKFNDIITILKYKGEMIYNEQ